MFLLKLHNVKRTSTVHGHLIAIFVHTLSCFPVSFPHYGTRDAVCLVSLYITGKVVYNYITVLCSLCII